MPYLFIGSLFQFFNLFYYKQELRDEADKKRLGDEADKAYQLKRDEEAYKKEVELVKQQRARQLEMYKTTDAFKAMEKAGDGSAEAFEEAWETATQNTVNAIEKTKGNVEKVKDLTKDIINQAVSAAAAAMSLLTQLVQQDAEAKIAEVDKMLKEEQEVIEEKYKVIKQLLDEERQEALEAAGLAASASSTNLEAAMQAAMDSMDAQVIYKERQRQKELLINKEFDDKEKAQADKRKAEEEKAEKEAAQKKLDIQYEADMAEWRANLVKGTADIAMGVIKAWAQGGGAMGPVLAGLVTVAGALQMASLIASAPKKQSLASGGIVEGSGPRGVDSVDTMLAPKEMVLNDAQQANLFSMIQQGSGGPVTQTIILEVDGQVLAQVTINAVNNGFGPFI
jgi:hypothetical protein